MEGLGWDTGVVVDGGGVGGGEGDVGVEALVHLRADGVDFGKVFLAAEAAALLSVTEYCLCLLYTESQQCKGI